MRRKRWMVMALLTLAPVAMASEKPAQKSSSSGTTKESREGWPDTREGSVARGWVEAFTAGEKPMRAFLAGHLSDEALAKRTLDQRLATYRDLKKQFGSLVLASIDEQSPGELKATLMVADASRHQFVFTVQTAAPYKLVSVGRLERHQVGGGFHH